MLNLDELCGCGKPVKYLQADGKGSCNKYKRCPSYDELVEYNKELVKKYSEVLYCANDLALYREGTDSYEKARVEIAKRLKESGSVS